MNPPYQLPKKINNVQKKGTIGGNLWSKFVKTANGVVVDGGYICSVHPPMWRKPEHEIYPMMIERNMLYLEMHSEKDGITTFKASTKYDWYLLQNNAYNGKTIIVDENGENHVLNLRNYKWLPCFNFNTINKILAKEKEKTCEVLYSRSKYGTDKAWMLKTQDELFKYPCVYSMTKNGFGCWYSSKKDFDFGVSKVILGLGRHLYPIIDMEGKYGLTQNTFAIRVNSKKEAENIKNAIQSDKFKELLKATKWGTFQTEWRMFKHFKKDFWREFI
jgi:hypothetical protein